MKVVLKSRTMCVWSCLVLLGAVIEATEPATQAIPFTWDFSTWDANSTNYPSGINGWKLGTSGSTQFILTPALSNVLMIAPSTAKESDGGIHNYSGKLGILDTSSGRYALACAINTSGKTNVTVAYDIMTIRNPFNGTTNTRTNECTLQYRIGTTGNFTLTGLSYTNDGALQTAGVTPQNPWTHTFVLPSTCDNQPIVQLRWAVRDLTGSGSRPSFALGRIQVTGEDAPVSLLPPQNIRVTARTATSLSLAWDVVPSATAYAIDVYSSLDTSGETFFAETFNGFSGESNVTHENQLDSHTQTNGWIGAAIYESLGSIRLGTGDTRGWIQTPPLNPPDTYSICFDAYAWDGTSEKTNMDVYAIHNGITNVLRTIQLFKTNFQHFVIQTESTSGTRIGFTAKQNTINRFCLDNLSLISTGHTHESVTNNMRVSCTTATLHGLTSRLQYQGVIRAIKDSEQSASSTEFTAKPFCATLIMLH